MPTKLSFHERMEGFFAMGVKDPVAAAAAGAAQGTSFALEVTIETDDLDKFIDDPKHTARVTGFYLGNFGPFTGKPFVKVKQGIFNFMSPGPGQRKLMEHHHLFEVDGTHYRLDGQKHLENEPATWDEWYDLTTLFTTIAKLEPGEAFEPHAAPKTANIVAAGITRFPARDTLKLLRSFQVDGTRDPWAARLKFLRLYLGSEAKVLLSAFAPFRAEHARRRLSAPKATLDEAGVDVVVVGSGYGGGVAAARLSAPGTKKVCLLERGREYRAGGFPDEAWEIPDALCHEQNPLGLYEFHVDPHIKALVGNGLGGTSLINASVMVRPDAGVMTTAPWPKALPDLAPYFTRAEAVLTPQPHPAPPLKSFAFRRAAEAAGNDVHHTGLVPIAVTFEDTERKAAALTQPACVGCGECVTGCNYGSKNSIDMNYVAIAEKQGAKVYTQVEVKTIEPVAGGFVVHARDHELRRDLKIPAKEVVLAAGTYGTFGILARSRAAHGLAVSPKLGSGFSGNGDVLGFGYNTALSTMLTEGPTITSAARYGAKEPPRRRLMIQEGGIPRPMIPFFRTAMPAAGLFTGVDTAHGIWNALKGFFRAAGDVVGIDQNGAMNHSFLFFGMGFEEDSGTLVLQDGKVGVHWPNVANEEFAKRADERMLAITAAAKGVYVDNPLSRQFLGDSLITAHPIGGCAMADDASGGVVDAKGQVFGQKGLYVADGSILSTPLGANPALTIAALAEYISEQIAAAW